MANITFAERTDKAQLEEGTAFAPKFDANGLIPCVTTDADTGELLMVAYMNEESLRRTMETGEAVYFSRSRQKLWHKGESSGNVQKVKELRTDCDQDCLWIRVEQIGGAACHTGHRSCFYRSVPVGDDLKQSGEIEMGFTEAKKVFDPKEVYGKGR